jgi:ankyrin repeat protein
LFRQIASSLVVLTLLADPASSQRRNEGWAPEIKAALEQKTSSELVYRAEMCGVLPRHAEQRACLFNAPGSATASAPTPDVKALLDAAMKGDSTRVQFLLGRDLSADSRGTGGETALHWASAYGRSDVAELLLARRADAAAIDASGSTPLHYAVQEGHQRVVTLLAKRSARIPNADGMTPLHLAAAHGHRDIAAILLREGAQIDAADMSGSTPLHLAALYGYAVLVQLLINEKADVRAEDTDGHTPLDLATQNQHHDIAHLLEAASK